MKMQDCNVHLWLFNINNSKAINFVQRTNDKPIIIRNTFGSKE